jgi:hypothetical protein
LSIENSELKVNGSVASRARRDCWSLQIVVAVVLALVSTAVLWHLIFSRVWPPSHDDARYAILLDHFREAFAQGHWYPRWLPNLNGGYGYPTFVFYQPGFFFFSLPFTLLPGYPDSTLRAVVWTLFVLGGFGAYRLCREFSGWKTALWCSVLFLSTPYLYVELYVRNDLSELTAMLACPWALLYGFRIDRLVREGWSPAGAMVGLACALAFIVYAHPAVALFALPTFWLAFVYHTWTGTWAGRRRVLVDTAGAFAGALLLSAPYWVVVFEMQRWVDMSRVATDYFLPASHVVYWRQFFSNAWDFGRSVPLSDQDTMSFQLGAPHFAIAVVGAVLAFSSRAIRACFFMYVALLIVMSPLGTALWALPIESLRQIQFPWRLLAVTASLQAVCAAGWGRTKVLRSILPILVIASGWSWYRPMFYPRVGSSSLAEEVQRQRALDLTTAQRYAAVGEFRPLTATPDPRERGAEPLIASAGVPLLPLPQNTPSHMRYRRADTSQTTDATIHQLYLPGWRVVVDGQSVPREVLESGLTTEGDMTVRLQPGARDLEAYYDGPPGWKLRGTLCAIGLAAFLALCVREQRRARSRN